MQLRQLNLRACPDEVSARIRALPENETLRRRAILSRGECDWRTALITLEALSTDASRPARAAPISFDDLVLEESWLRPHEAVEFLAALSEGGAVLGPARATLRHPQHWSLERLTANNSVMPGAGIVAQGALQFEKQFSYGIFLSADGAYFPSLDDAIRHWSPFSPCHGADDGRLGNILISLPEQRARFETVSARDNMLQISLAGEALTSGDIRLAVAVSIDGKIANERCIIDRASIETPLFSPHDWWDVALSTKDGELLDKWSSRDFARVRGTESAERLPLEALVRQALDTGEGQRVEFKPFVDLPPKTKARGAEKADLKKLSECARTAVAMANAGGGHILMGVTDDCALSGNYAKITNWGACDLTEGLLDEYRRALLVSLNDHIVTDAPLTVKGVSIDGANILLIEIPPVQGVVAELAGDTNYYVRRGASNRRVPPSEWRRTRPRSPDLVLPFEVE